MSSERAAALCTIVLLAGAAASGCARFERGQPSEQQVRDAGARDAALPPVVPGEELSFAEDVFPILEAACGRCHGPGGDETDAFELGASADDAYDRVLRLSNAEDPNASALLRFTRGSGHARIIAADSPDYTTIAAWMAGGEQP